MSTWEEVSNRVYAENYHRLAERGHELAAEDYMLASRAEVVGELEIAWKAYQHYREASAVAIDLDNRALGFDLGLRQ